MSSTQDAVNVCYMFMLYGIMWELPEADREYHTPFLRKFSSGTSGREFVWTIQMWETHEADREYC